MITIYLLVLEFIMRTPVKHSKSCQIDKYPVS